VTWSVQEGAGGGTVNSSGTYTAPATAGTYHVIATSVADPAKQASATVLVTAAAGISVSIAPTLATIQPSASFTFMATVSGTVGGQSTAVTWSVQEAGGGTVDASGRYVAPATEGTYHVIANSVADPSRRAPATVAVSAFSALPADRRTVWNPGLVAVGGIPNRTTTCATVNASTYGNGTQDASAGIQAALDACPLGHANYLAITKGITLRGAGATQTTLTRTNGADMDPNSPRRNPAFVQAPVIIVGPTRWPNYGSSVNLTADAVKGTYSVTVANTSGLVVGDIVEIDELDDPGLVVWNPGDLPDGYSWFSRYRRPIAEWKEITRIVGNTVTFNTPLHTRYRTSFTAQLTPMAAGNKHVKNAGVENLKVRGGSEGNIELIAAAYSWVKSVDSTYWSGVSVSLQKCFRCELRDSYLHDGEWPFPGGGGYAMSLENGTSDSLFENNISITTVVNPPNAPDPTGVNKVMVSRAAGAGSVVAYNYVDNGLIAYNLGWQEVGINGSHMTGSHHMLFEGNYSFNADGDATHGNQTYHTFYRNHLTGTRSLYLDIDNRRCAGLAKGNWWMSFLGNVLGMPGPGWLLGQWTYEWHNPPWANSGTGSVWELGYDDGNWSAAGDSRVLSTLIRHGNFDYLTNSVNWDPNTSERVLPNSLYLSQRPAFFNAGRGYVWPWVDPTGATKLYTLPAKARYDAGTPFIQP
jgi:hypothetical protein